MSRQLAKCYGIALLLILGTITGCTDDPAVTKKKAFDQGVQYLKDGKYNEAVIAFRNSLQIDPDYADARHQLGRTYRRKGWVVDARTEFEKALKARPDLVDARYELGQVLVEMGLFQDAEKEGASSSRRRPGPRSPDCTRQCAARSAEVRRSGARF